MDGELRLSTADLVRAVRAHPGCTCIADYIPPAPNLTAAGEMLNNALLMVKAGRPAQARISLVEAVQALGADGATALEIFRALLI